MRRAEFKITEPQLLIPLLQQAGFMVLGLVDAQGHPYQTQVNGVWFEQAVWFHSSPGGSKMRLIGAGAPAHLVATESLSLLPSDFFDPESPCRATQFFLSVHLAGQAIPVVDSDQKCAVLNALMARFQPQGGYRPLTPGGPDAAEMAKTAVIRVEPQQLVGKFKLGQNLQPAAREALQAKLQQRGTALDLLTLAWMQKIS